MTLHALPAVACLEFILYLCIGTSAARTYTALLLYARVRVQLCETGRRQDRTGLSGAVGERRSSET